MEKDVIFVDDPPTITQIFLRQISHVQLPPQLDNEVS